jgi:hypothetical protein
LGEQVSWLRRMKPINNIRNCFILNVIPFMTKRNEPP